MSPMAEPHSGWTLRWMTLALFLSQILFLWMYFSSESVEQLARLGRTGIPAAASTADEFAARWRHGMAGNSPLYMPGFFLTALFTWLWALGRRLSRVSIGGVALMLLAAVVAGFLAPMGAVRALRGFEEATGVRCQGATFALTVRGAGAAVFTLFTWEMGMICVQLSIARRSILPMWPAIVLNLVLARIRPWTVGEFTSQWLRDSLQGRLVALLSLLAVPALAAFMVLHQLSRSGVFRRAPSS